MSSFTSLAWYVSHMFAADLSTHRHLDSCATRTLQQAELHCDLRFDRCMRPLCECITCVPYHARAPKQDDSIIFLRICWQFYSCSPFQITVWHQPFAAAMRPVLSVDCCDAFPPPTSDLHLFTFIYQSTWSGLVYLHEDFFFFILSQRRFWTEKFGVWRINKYFEESNI